jgi:hypothetical protein
MNAELDEIMIEFERSTSLDWEGSPAQAAHTRIKEALHAQIMSALTGGGAAPAPLEAGGYRENPFLDPMPTIPRSPTFSLSILNGWEAEYKASWQKSGGKYDPYNDALARKGFAANREYIAWLDRVADAQLARDMTDFGTEYWKISSMVIAPLGAVDTAYHILNGDMTAGEAAFALATMGKGRALKAAETTVIGRVKDLKALQSGERSLLDRLPDLGSPKANWKQNSGVLRQEMSLSRPIRDASPGDTGGQFLNAERNLLRDRGWTFDPKTYYWHPPKR